MRRRIFTPQIHLIRNAYVRPHYEAVEPRLFPITGRTITALVRTQGIGDFFRIWALAERDDLDLNVTWIPEEAREKVGVTPDETFDSDFMKALFDFGYRRALDGEAWLDFEKALEERNLKSYCPGQTDSPGAAARGGFVHKIR